MSKRRGPDVNLIPLLRQSPTVSHRRFTALLMCALLVSPSITLANTLSSIAAIERSRIWIEAHRVDARTATLPILAFDAWARYVIATLHPDPAIRMRVGLALDADLHSLSIAAPTQSVPLTYWAILLRVMSKRGLDIRAHAADTRARVPLDLLLASMDPTTAYWTVGLLHYAGVSDGEAAYFAKTWLARTATAPSATYVPSFADAYRAFHELVPRTDLGALPARLTPAQQQFAGRAVPALLRFCRTGSHVDALAEAMVAATLVGLGNDPEWDAGRAYLLSQQRADGTFIDPERGARTPSVDEDRHTVLVALWALLARPLADRSGDPDKR